MIINHSLITIIRNHFLQQVRFREDSLGLRDIFTYLGNAQVSLAAVLGQTILNTHARTALRKIHTSLNEELSC